MEVINYFKIKCLLNTIVGEELQMIFKDKWYYEECNDGGMNEYKEWWNNENNGYALLSNFQNVYGNLNKFEQSIIKKGSLESFSVRALCQLLLNFNSVKQDSELTSYINSINDINYKVLKVEFKLKNKEFKEIKEKLISLTIQYYKCKKLSNLIQPFLKNIDFILDSLQVQSLYNKLINKFESEKLFIVNLIKDNGNKEFKRNEFSKSIELYKHALAYKLSNKNKSLFNLNISTAEYSKFKQYMNIGMDTNSDNGYNGNDDSMNIDLTTFIDHSDTFIDDDDYQDDSNSLKRSKIYAINSIINTPSWFKPYYRLAQVLYINQEHKLAIQLFDAAIILIKLDPPSLSLLPEIEKLKKECELKLLQ